MSGLSVTVAGIKLPPGDNSDRQAPRPDMKPLTCHSALHDTRGGENDGRDWRKITGWYSGDFPSAPHYCNRCAFHDGKSLDSMPPEEAARRAAALIGV